MMPKYSKEYIAKRLKWYHECHSFIEFAEYQKATQHAKKGLKLFPDDTIVAFTYFSIMADYALSSNSKKFKIMHKVAVAGMKKLLGRTSGRGISQNYKKTMKNEYYYQTKQFKKQYELGISFTKRHKNKYAMYSAGVGSANYALVLAKKGEMRRAKIWAKKSINAWKIYFEVDKKYYNPYVHLALAYGILGEVKKMERSLKKAAKLSGKGLVYKEFQDVIDEVNGLL